MNVYAVVPFELNAEQLLLTHRGVPVALGPKVVETLLALIERPGEPLSKRALIARIWPDSQIDAAGLAQNVYVLRRTFRAYGSPAPIETVPRFGYRYAGQVCLVSAQALPGRFTLVSQSAGRNARAL